MDLKIFITGSNGLLGQKLVAQLLKSGISFIASSQGENRNPNCPTENYISLDIANEAEVNQCIERFQPSHLIHTAAITNVDECELNPDKCYSVNVLGSKYLFESCKKQNIHFQLLSTDFVFDGVKGNYSEEDEVHPLSVYAQSKVDAENLLKKDAYQNWSIVRTIIVYGVGENLSRSNLLVWAKSALAKGDSMSVIDDQFRAPTWADDLAWGCIQICKLNKNGIYHLSGPTTYSIYEIVELVAKYYQFSMDNVTKITSEKLNQPAKRPPKTGFNLSKAKRDLNYTPKSIEDTLDLF